MILKQSPMSRYGRFVGIAFAALACAALLFSAHRQRDVLVSFKDKTIATITGEKEQPPWLLATISPAQGLQRRTIIRSTWQRLYANSSRFETRFVISNVTELWQPLIDAENATYGDLVMLPNIVEDRRTANSIKPMEFFKSLVEQNRERHWAFVSKIDDDSFLDATTFYDKYLQPMLDAEEQPPAHTVIGRRLGEIGGYQFPYPGGQFYTLTWDLLDVIVGHYAAHGPGWVQDEDALIGALLKNSSVEWNFEEMPREAAFDFGGEGKDGPRNKESPWAGKEANLHAGSHGVSVGAINLHSLKEDDDYLRVAACFDEEGLKIKEWADGLIG